MLCLQFQLNYFGIVRNRGLAEKNIKDLINGLRQNLFGKAPVPETPHYLKSNVSLW